MENGTLIDLIYTNPNSLSLEVCNDMIRLFEEEDNRYAGIITSGLNTQIKDTTDFIITEGGSRWKRINQLLANELNNNVIEYVKTCDNMGGDKYHSFGPCMSTMSMQLQKYNKDVGKYVYHNDSLCDFKEKQVRRITFMWYLNNVEEGGETEFWSKYMIKPTAGKLVLFPACWTFPHKAKVPTSSDKYIITGWLWEHFK